jgi:hypothetical protein
MIRACEAISLSCGSLLEFWWGSRLTVLRRIQ